VELLSSIPDGRLPLEETLSVVPPEQRRVLDVVHRGGLTFAEIACGQRVAPGMVKSRVHPALLTLRISFRRSGEP